MKLFGRGKKGPSREPSPDRVSNGEASQGGDKRKRNLKDRLGDKNRYAWLLYKAEGNAANQLVAYHRMSTFASLFESLSHYRRDLHLLGM